MKKLVTLLMTGIFLIPLTLAFASQEPAPADKKADTKQAAPKKEKKAKKSTKKAKQGEETPAPAASK